MHGLCVTYSLARMCEEAVAGWQYEPSKRELKAAAGQYARRVAAGEEQRACSRGHSSRLFIAAVYHPEDYVELVVALA